MSFEKAADAIKESGKNGAKMTDDEMKQIYGLFKQGTVGDNATDKPGMLDFKGKAKWEAWTAQKGKSKEDAQNEYVALAKTLLAKYGFNDLANSF
jgi:diazepam-binding inhibitor (GABA receptor modulating acyl-CoA-binding protein)